MLKMMPLSRIPLVAKALIFWNRMVVFTMGTIRYIGDTTRGE
jgi:hypothetical protein